MLAQDKPKARSRVERSESLDEREARARINDVMAVRHFAVS
jgi:hypothetical protein